MHKHKRNELARLSIGLSIESGNAPTTTISDDNKTSNATIDEKFKSRETIVWCHRFQPYDNNRERAKPLAVMSFFPLIKTTAAKSSFSLDRLLSVQTFHPFTLCISIRIHDRDRELVFINETMP